MSDETKTAMGQLAMLPVLRLYPHPANPRKEAVAGD